MLRLDGTTIVSQLPPCPLLLTSDPISLLLRRCSGHKYLNFPNLSTGELLAIPGVRGTPNRKRGAAAPAGGGGGRGSDGGGGGSSDPSSNEGGGGGSSVDESKARRSSALMSLLPRLTN